MPNTIYDMCVKLKGLLRSDFRSNLINKGVLRTEQTHDKNVYIKTPLLRAEIDTEIEMATKQLSDLLAAKELIRN